MASICAKRNEMTKNDECAMRTYCFMAEYHRTMSLAVRACVYMSIILEAAFHDRACMASCDHIIP